MAQVNGDCRLVGCPLQQPALRLQLATTQRMEWARAYAAQSQSDFGVYRILAAAPEAEDCHSLHYLQMACEKIAKAYRLRDTQTPLEQEMRSHVAASKFVDNLLSSPQIKLRYRSQSEKLQSIKKASRKLMREIEKLAPAVDAEQSPSNAEYPWSDGQRIVIPCRYTYPNLVLLKEQGGREVLKLIKLAIEDFEHITIT